MEIIIAFLGIVVGAVVGGFTWQAARAQAKSASVANELSSLEAKSEAVMHFTDRFFDLLKAGDPKVKILKNDDWTHQFWSLHATEFYFFHHGMLPIFMYTLWMIELANLYASNEEGKIWESHKRYLEVYVSNYREMAEFFTQIYEYSKSPEAEGMRNKALSNWVKDWVAKNKQADMQ